MKDTSTSKKSLDILKVVKKRDNSNLIDLTPYDAEPESGRDKSVRVSVLEAFDPLLMTGINLDSGKTKMNDLDSTGMSTYIFFYCFGKYIMNSLDCYRCAES